MTAKIIDFSDHFPVASETQRAELTLLFHCEFNLETKNERILFRSEIGCSEGEYEHLKNKYSRVLERYRKELSDAQNA